MASEEKRTNEVTPTVKKTKKKAKEKEEKVEDEWTVAAPKIIKGEKKIEDRYKKMVHHNAPPLFFADLRLLRM